MHEDHPGVLLPQNGGSEPVLIWWCLDWLVICGLVGVGKMPQNQEKCRIPENFAEKPGEKSEESCETFNFSSET